jgi:hypothetical protein
MSNKGKGRPKKSITGKRVQVLLRLPEELNHKLTIYKALHRYSSKEDAIIEMIKKELEKMKV